MAGVDRSSLWSSGRDESVEVNQRALIDKVLARYSGEFTVFRELLQNSDDAASKAVEILFDSQAYLDKPGESVHDQVTLPDLKQNVHQWRFRNNGMIFTEADWSRLRKIAEGNPDEEKIGAFGVGFYSLFSVTEEPFVKSGNEWMGFYWKDKKDQLFARRGTTPLSDSTDPYRDWTTFEMGLRDAAPIPHIFDFVRFLTSSITFMTHLENVAVWFDGMRLANITKDKGFPRECLIPNNLRRTSDGGMMSVSCVTSTSLKISTEVLGLIYISRSEKKIPSCPETRALKGPTHSGFFSTLLSSLSASSPVAPSTASSLPPPEVDNLHLMSPVTSHIVLSIYAARVEVNLDRKMVNELHRSTKKNPPNKLRLELIYTGKDEYEASMRDEENVSQMPASIFQGLRADLDGTGSARVYIGHATGQTTGLGGHISGRFIPTVERESIDLVDNNVAVWNKELLYVAGLLARVAYEIEMADVQSLWNGASETTGALDATVPLESRFWLQSRVIHALKFFTHYRSTPSPIVSNLIEAAFFAASLDNSFPMISTVGVLDAQNIRAYDVEYSGFLRQLPMIPSDVASSAKKMVDALRSRGLIRDITFADVLTELRSRTLTQQEMIECLKWRLNLGTDGIRPAYLTELRREFLDAAVFTITEEGEEKVIPLLRIETVYIPRNAASFIPLDTPFPNHTLPFSVSKHLKSESLPSVFGWTELTIPVWLNNVLSFGVQNSAEQDMTRSAAWAGKILNVLARSWASLPKDHQSQIMTLLKNKTCIPTKFGMKQPEEAYFPNANIFPDLPIVTMPGSTFIKGALEKVLDALGVRRHVDLQIVFDRMIRTGDWGIPELIRYLVAVEGSLTPPEINRLRETVAFPKEEPEQLNETLPTDPNVASPSKPSKIRFKAMDLYEPSNGLRELKLPIIAWGNSPRWRASSDEAKFLYKLGLRKHPLLADLLPLAASQNPAIRRAALKYFLDNTSRYPDYDPKFFPTIPYIPAARSDGVSVMGKPQEVFVDKEAGMMGFLILDTNLPPDAATKLKLINSPPTALLLPILESSPISNIATARKRFEYLATRLADFSPSELQRLSSVAFIPVPMPPHLAGTTVPSPASTLIAPHKCFLNKGSGEGFHSQFFTFVDFGPRANSFLIACGVRNEPTVDELAKTLVADPRNFYNLAGGLNKFLIELRNIAANYRGVSISTRNQMKKCTCLVGLRRVRTSRTSTETRSKKVDDFSDDDQGEWEHDLLPPEKIAIVDDTATYTLFDAIFSAPQEDVLEELYAALGSPRLSKLVREDYKPSSEIPNSRRALETRSLVLERLPIFLHERTHAAELVSYSWLNNDDNFIVREVGKLTLTRTLQFGTIKMSKLQEASATADRKGKGPIRLLIGGNSQMDLYEVSNSLCRVLLKSHKPNDSLLFMTILSTDLRALRRRGFNVDRILRQQQAQMEAQKAHGQQLISDAKEAQAHNLKRRFSQGSTKDDSPGGRPWGGLFSNWRQKLYKQVNTIQSSPISPPPVSPPYTRPIFNNTGDAPDPMRPYGRVPSWSPNEAVTPHANIERNVRTAIEGCKPERNSVVHSNAQAIRIREAVDEGYCDVVGANVDLKLAGYFGGNFKVYVAGNDESKAVLESKKAAVSRFGDLVLQPLIDVYNIPSTSCHIFYDFQGPLIAFNRSGSLFLNLRYYEAWHDADVQKGDISRAYVSWFFTFAHEIAHNLVHPHNSEHEFYFSTICEHHMVKLAQLLGSAQRPAS